MEALAIICTAILAIIFIGIVITDWIVDSQLHGGFIKAWKFKRYWKKLHKY